jgi:hypothetical protein
LYHEHLVFDYLLPSAEWQQTGPTWRLVNCGSFLGDPPCKQTSTCWIEWTLLLYRTKMKQMYYSSRISFFDTTKKLLVGVRVQTSDFQNCRWHTVLRRVHK